MQRHFVQELEALKTNIIKMGSLAERAIAMAIQSLLEGRKEPAVLVIAQDKEVNEFEVTINEQIVDLLALQQPVATDLRFILAASGITTDLERIGDHAVNIAESAVAYARFSPIASLVRIPKMAELTQKMLRDAIDGFIHSNPGLCRSVLANDDVVDDLNRQVVSDLVAIMHNDSNAIEPALELIRVSRNLERVADLATNIAEDVIFMADAQIVKHRLGERTASNDTP